MYDGTIQSGVAILKDKYKLNEGTISKLLGLDITTLDDDYMSNYTDQTNHREKNTTWECYLCYSISY